MFILFGGECRCMVFHLSDLLRQLRTYHCQVKFLDMEAGEERDMQECAELMSEHESYCRRLSYCCALFWFQLCSFKSGVFDVAL